MARLVRMGIDVGGTHTKAVAMDNATHEIIGKSSVKTTHDDKRGVAAGVVKAFQNCLKENHIEPDDVVFVAHSTTQATNALLEGDVATVGVIGMAKGFLEGVMAKRQTNIKDIDLGTGRSIKILNTYLDTKKMTDDSIKEAIRDLKTQGAQVLVASMAFGVDDDTKEQMVYKAADFQGIPTTMASDITKLYGLTRRTRTAAINASILPKMLDTATSTEMSVREAGVHVPLMIMRGDGGVMDISEMKKRPVLTMLSGPAASSGSTSSVTPLLPSCSPQQTLTRCAIICAWRFSPSFSRRRSAQSGFHCDHAKALTRAVPDKSSSTM